MPATNLWSAENTEGYESLVVRPVPPLPEFKPKACRRVVKVKSVAPEWGDDYETVTGGSWVIVQFEINEQGERVRHYIFDSSPEGVLDYPVSQSVAGWEFEPCIINGKAVPYKGYFLVKK